MEFLENVDAKMSFQKVCLFFRGKTTCPIKARNAFWAFPPSVKREKPGAPFLESPANLILGVFEGPRYWQKYYFVSSGLVNLLKDQLSKKKADRSFTIGFSARESYRKRGPEDNNNSRE